MYQGSRDGQRWREQLLVYPTEFHRREPLTELTLFSVVLCLLCHPFYSPPIITDPISLILFHSFMKATSIMTRCNEWYGTTRVLACRFEFFGFLYSTQSRQRGLGFCLGILCSKMDIQSPQMKQQLIGLSALKWFWSRKLFSKHPTTDRARRLLIVLQY